jgi:hypothetical protein
MQLRGAVRTTAARALVDRYVAVLMKPTRAHQGCTHRTRSGKLIE